MFFVMTLSSLSIFEKKDVNASLSLELVSFNEVQNIIKYRCGKCHAKYPTIEGIEGDFQWSPLDGLLIGGAFTQLDVSFDSFIGGCTVAQDIAYRAANRTVVSTPMGPRVIYGTCTQDLKGKTGVFAPEMSTSLFAEYVVAGTSDFNIVLGADVNKVGEFYSQNDLDPANLSPETTKQFLERIDKEK